MASAIIRPKYNSTPTLRLPGNAPNAFGPLPQGLARVIFRYATDIENVSNMSMINKKCHQIVKDLKICRFPVKRLPTVLIREVLQFATGIKNYGDMRVLNKKFGEMVKPFNPTFCADDMSKNNPTDVERLKEAAAFCRANNGDRRAIPPSCILHHVRQIKQHIRSMGVDHHYYVDLLELLPEIMPNTEVVDWLDPLTRASSNGMSLQQRCEEVVCGWPKLRQIDVIESDELAIAASQHQNLRSKWDTVILLLQDDTNDHKEEWVTNKGLEALAPIAPNFVRVSLHSAVCDGSVLTPNELNAFMQRCTRIHRLMMFRTIEDNVLAVFEGIRSSGAPLVHVGIREYGSEDNEGPLSLMRYCVQHFPRLQSFAVSDFDFVPSTEQDIDLHKIDATPAQLAEWMQRLTTHKRGIGIHNGSMPQCMLMVGSARMDTEVNALEITDCKAKEIRPLLTLACRLPHLKNLIITTV